MCKCKNKKNLILQIGRLDKNIEEDLDFIYEGKSYKAPLSSIALKKHLGEDETKVILLYPVSLPFNPSFNNYKLGNPFYEDINAILNNSQRREKYLKNPKSLFDKHPHSKLVNYNLPIHSIGGYGGINFQASIEDFILYIFSYLIKKYLTCPFENLYIDITSGLNIYIVALLEAAKYFQVWENLYNLEKNKHINVFIVYSDPIIGSSKNKYNIYIYPLKTKTFFSLPINYNDIKNGISKNLIERDLGENRAIKNNLNIYLEDSIVWFSSIYNTAPLFWYNYDLRDLKEIKKFFRNKIIIKILSKYKKNWQKTFTIDQRNAINILLSIGFLMGIIKLLKSKNISKRDIEIDKLESDAEDIYKHLKLNVQLGLFKHEIQANFGNDYKRISPTSEWKPLTIYLKNSSEKEDKEDKKKIEQRNFFAHAGFERNVTLIRKNERDKIVLKYDDEYLDEIIKILKVKV